MNVGQGDSCIIKVTGLGDFYALIDTGKAEASSAVISALQDTGCSQLDVLVLTYPDADHVGGAIDIMNTFPVGQVWDPGIDGDNTQTWQNVKGTIAAKGILRVNPDAGETYRWGGTKISVLNPPAGISFSDTNNNSIAFIETLGDQDLMFTGDVEDPAQKYMMDMTFPTIEVFKVPYHGGDSGCYEPFFNKVAPQNSVVSVGPNSYGHPSNAVLNLLAGFGTVYRTDQNGNVTVEATSNTLQITCDTMTQTTTSSADWYRP